MEKTISSNEMRQAFESVRVLKEAKNQEEFDKAMDAIYVTTDEYLNELTSTIIEKKQTLLRNLEMGTSEELDQMEIEEAEPGTNKRKATPHDYSSFDGYCSLLIATLLNKPPIVHVPVLSHSWDDTDEDQLDDDDNDRLIIDESTQEEPNEDDDVILIDEDDNVIIIEESSEDESHEDGEVNSDSDQSVPRDSGVETASSETESENANGETTETVRTPSSPVSVAQLPEQNESRGVNNEPTGTVSAPSLPATVEEPPEEDENSEFVTIGPNGTQVLRSEFNKISWDSDSISTRNLLNIIFGEDMLATHTLSGKPSPAFKGRERPAKGQLDINKINDLTHCVMQKTGCTEHDVRSTITTKCSDVGKKYRKRQIKISYTDLKKE